MANGSESSESQVTKLGNDDKLMVSMSFKADPPSSNAESLNEKTEDEDEDEDEDEEVAEAPEIRRMGKHHHHSSSESIAGGTVIIGGLVTTIFAAVFCYIRVTRRNNSSTIDGKI
ncbi:hypothetical protein C5167_039312 [Papaver somniferum]|uniref:Uncharacterized protein n=1 Tax=Papaver somniferum TaxID=3469 RepID=A0A4Y7IBZ2_PAPSO|nr:hypothetical protein C5167_039312 [Papaver somniferum]